MVKLESAVIVKNDHGYVATVRFNDPMKDKFISSNSKPVLYKLVEEHITKVLHV